MPRGSVRFGAKMRHRSCAVAHTDRIPTSEPPQLAVIDTMPYLVSYAPVTVLCHCLGWRPWFFRVFPPRDRPRRVLLPALARGRTRSCFHRSKSRGLLYRQVPRQGKRKVGKQPPAESDFAGTGSLGSFLLAVRVPTGRSCASATIATRCPWLTLPGQGTLRLVAINS